MVPYYYISHTWILTILFMRTAKITWWCLWKGRVPVGWHWGVTWVPRGVFDWHRPHPARYAHQQVQPTGTWPWPATTYLQWNISIGVNLTPISVPHAQLSLVILWGWPHTSSKFATKTTEPYTGYILDIFMFSSHCELWIEIYPFMSSTQNMTDVILFFLNSGIE